MLYDEVIVGSGAGGAVLASRLSEDADRRVLLLEAGPDYPDLTQRPADLIDPWISLSNHDWGYSAEFPGDRSMPYPRGKVVGGSTAVNAAAAMRAAPTDLDDWVALGNDEWSYAEVLPFYKRLEHQNGHDIDEAVHSRSGPIWIGEPRPSQSYGPLGSGFCEALGALGYPQVPEHNNGNNGGVGPISHNIRNGARFSAAEGYLGSVRDRPNLIIRSQCLVDRVLFDGTRAVGVEVVTPTGREQVHAKRVTLSAGTIGTPAILVRSGIGPADTLRDLGVDVLVECSAVGRHFKDHTMVIMAWPVIDAPGHDPLDYFEFYFRDGAGYIALLTLFDPRPLTTWYGDPNSPPVFALAPAVARPRSTGRVEVTSLDPEAAPRVAMNVLSDPQDRKVLLDMVRLGHDLVQQPSLRDRLGPMMTPQAALDDDAALERWMLETCGTGYHPVGSCRMGPHGDPDAVVDQHGRVRGISGLRIADASIMPDIVSAPVNLTCLMIGERIAAWMAQETD